MRRLVQALVIGMAMLASVIAFTHDKLLPQEAEQTVEVKCDNPAGCFGLLEQAITAAPAGTTIQLSIGTFYENPLIINKNLTIRGATPEKTFIRGMRSQTSRQPVSYPLFHIESDSEIHVSLKDLAIVTIHEEVRHALFSKGRVSVTLDHSIILNDEGLTGIVITGRSFLTISNSVVTGGTGGIEVNDSAVLTLLDSRLFKSGIGLEVHGAGVAQLKNCIISRNQIGVIVSDSARTYLENCKISYIHFYGFLAEGSAQFELSDSETSDSLGAGILISDSAKGRVVRSSITSNAINGIMVVNSAVVEIQNSFIADNGIALGCKQQDGDPENICNGVVGRGSPQLVIENSVIRNNTDWGVATFLKQCGYREDDFTGKVVFSGENKIGGNNKSGNHSNIGNPGIHPFKGLPSGQICVP